MGEMYKRRQGIAWQNELYLKLLQFVGTNNLMINENTHNSLSTEQLQNLTINVFPKYGHRRAYKEKVLFFLQCHFETIIKDISNLNNGMKDINAPSLQQWLTYKKKLSVSMSMLSIRQDINKFLANANYQLPPTIKSSILHQMYSVTEDKDIEPWMVKKFNNTLWFNRKEICNEINAIIFNSSLNIDSVDQEDFCGFTVKEINIAIASTNILHSVTSKLNAESKFISEKINETIQEALLVPDMKTNKTKYTLKKKMRRRSVICFEKVSEDVLEFFETKGTSDQLELFKKLVILYMHSKNNTALKKFMTGTTRISHENKQIILECIYDNDCLKDSYYSLLDLLKSKRYLIKQKANEINNLLKINSISFEKELEGKSFFSDIEPKFYEVLQKVSGKSVNARV